MALSTGLESTFDDLKKKYPELENSSDEELNSMAKFEYPGLARGKTSANTSPQFLNSFQTWFDYGIDEGSYGWMKSAYNNSLTGLTEQLVTGKQRYSLEDYDPNILEDIGSMALSFLMPLDMLAMSVGGGIAKGVSVGGVAGKGVLGKGLSGLAQEGIKKRAGKEFGKRLWHTAIPTAITQGTTLAVYEGAMGGVQAAINEEDVMTGIGKGVIHGGLLGGAAGAVGGGLMGKNAQLVSKFMDEGKMVDKAAKVAKAKVAMTASEKAQLALTGMPGQIVAESGTFTVAEQVERAAHGEEISPSSVLVSFGKNLGLFGLMKGQSKLIERGKKHAGMLIEAEKAKQISEEAKSFLQAHENVMEQVRKAEKEGDSAQAESYMESAKLLLKEHGIVEKGNQDRIAEITEHRDRLDRINKGEIEATPEALMDIIDGLNGTIGVVEGLRGTKLYKGLEGELVKQEKLATDLLDSITNPHMKPVKAAPKKIKEAKPLEVEPKAGVMAKEVQASQKQFASQRGQVKEKIGDIAPGLGKMQNEGLVNRIAGQASAIAKGATNLSKSMSSDVAPHVVNILKKLKTRTSDPLLAEGKKRFGGEEGLTRTLNDLAAGNLKGQKKAQAEAWVEKFWNNTNQKLGWLTPGDVGVKPVGSLKKVGQKELNKFNAGIKVVEKQLKSAGIEKGTRLIDNAREQIFGTKDYTVKEATYGQLEAYKEFITSKHKEYSPIINNNYSHIKKLENKAGISKEASKNYLEAMAVKEGKIENASKTAMEQYESFLRNEHGVEITHNNSVDFIHSIKNKNFESGIGKLIGRAFTPVWKVLKDNGLDKIAQSLLGHETTEHVVYRGPGEKALYEIKQQLGRDKSKMAADMFDVPRLQRRMMRKEKVEDYTPKEIKRIEKEFDVKLDKKEIDKLVKEYTKEGEVSKEELEFWKNMNKKDTPENLAWGQWQETSKWYWDSISTELQRHGLSEKNAKELAKELADKEVQGYMTRRLTQKALERFDKLTKDNEYIKELVNKNLKNAALKEAKIKLPGKSKKEINAKAKELRDSEAFQDKVAREILTGMQYGFANVKSPHLIERGALLPEYMNIPNNKGQIESVKIYESSFNGSAEAYVHNMSKYLASLRHLPEWTGLGTKYGLGSNSRSIIEGMEKSRNLGGYAVKAIKRQLGLDRSDLLANNRPMWKAVSRFTNMSAALGLSSPLSGIKNTLIGIPRTAGDFGFINTMRGVGHFFANPAEAKRIAREKGYLEYGAKSMDLGTIGPESFSMRRLFRFNLMSQTEGFNRIVSAHAGRLYFNQAKAVLRGEPAMFTMGTNKRRMRRVMEELYKLDNNEIAIIEASKTQPPHERPPELQKQIDAIHQKVEHYSHLSSQGGTSTVMLPLWMSSKEGRPLTLFQRMAMSTTIDSYNNFVKPIREFGNIMPMARAAMAHTVSGAALYWMYDELLGKEPPTGTALNQSDNFDKAMMNLWRSEFLGVFGEVLSPYDRELGIPIMQPVILRNLGDAAEQFYQIAGGGKSLGQGTKDWVKNTFVAYSQFEQAVKMRRREGGEYYEKMGRIRKMTRKFKKERGMGSFSPQGLMSRRQPYYRKLKDAFLFGNPDDIGKEYWKAYNFIVTDLEQQNPYTTPQQRSKDAKRALKSVLSHYDPLNLSDDPKGTRKSVKRQFYSWLDEDNVGMAKSIEKEYQYRMRKYNRIINQPRYRRQYSVYPYF